MHWASGICFAAGVIIALVFWTVLLIQAFKSSILWGFGYFIPVISVVFILTHWERAKKPFLYSLLAIPFYVLAFVFLRAAA
jgi:hypothetical protein